MDKYINGGIVKEMTVYLKCESDLTSVIAKLKELINLDLYDMKVFDNAVFFELSADYLKENIVSFLEEINAIKIPSFIDYKIKIDYINEHFDENIDDILEGCDDFFKERFRMQDTFSINDSSFYLDILCYVFYIEGPYEDGNFEGLLKYIHTLQKSILKSPLGGTLCYGINS